MQLPAASVCFPAQEEERTRAHDGADRLCSDLERAECSMVRLEQLLGGRRGRENEQPALWRGHLEPVAVPRPHREIGADWVCQPAKNPVAAANARSRTGSAFDSGVSDWVQRQACEGSPGIAS